MFYHCSRYQFDFPGSHEAIVAGGVIAASAVPRMSLMRRRRRIDTEYPWLAHRVLDPQLYLANLPATAKHASNLATYPWFGAAIPEWDSQEHRVVADWMEMNDAMLREGWSRKTPHPTLAASTALELQVNFGVEAIILPAPLTNTPADQFKAELEYIDAGINFAKLRNIRLPLYASVVITDSVLRGIAGPENPLLTTISNQIAAREELEGAYLVIEQSADSGHYYNCEEGCLALLLLIDDLTRGAGKKIIVNYAGIYGLVCMAAGAETWVSGHYRSQRRLHLADEEEEGGGAFPRYFSPRLLGDIGLQHNVDIAFGSSLRDWLFQPTTKANKDLLLALKRGRHVEHVVDWAYSQQNLPVAAQHYYEVCVLGDAFMRELAPVMRVRAVQHWLERAVQLSEELIDLPGLKKGSHTDLGHQKVWLNAFRKWRDYSGT